MAIHAFWGDIFKQSEAQDILSVIKEIPLFKELKYLELIKLAKTLHFRKYFQNEIVFHEKEPGAGMYIVKSGQVKVYIKKLDGSETELTRLERGSFFGEIALLDEAPRSASAVATDDTELLGFFRSDLITLMDRDPRLSSKILLHLSLVIGQRLRHMNKEVKYGKNS